MLEKAVSFLEINSVLKFKCCCGRNCVKNFQCSEIRKVRTEFWQQPKNVRMFILKNFVQNSKKVGKFTMFLVRKDISVCSKAFLRIFRINKNTLTRATTMLEANVMATGFSKPKCKAKTTLELVSWLEEYASYNTDRMPDTMTCFLPYGTRKMDIYAKYRSESSTPASKSTFFRTWSLYFPHLKIKKVS